MLGMIKVSSKLFRSDRAYFHWCPGCEKMHPLPDQWIFDGNLEQPSFTPSFKHTMGRGGRTCHYTLSQGTLNFCDDSTHILAGKSVPLPDLPIHSFDSDEA